MVFLSIKMKLKGNRAPPLEKHAAFLSNLGPVFGVEKTVARGATQSKGLTVCILKPGMCVGVIKQKLIIPPKTIPHLSTQAFVYGTAHIPLRRRTKRVCLLLQKLHLQQVFSLSQDSPLA